MPCLTLDFYLLSHRENYLNSAQLHSTMANYLDANWLPAELWRSGRGKEGSVGDGAVRNERDCGEQRVWVMMRLEQGRTSRYRNSLATTPRYPQERRGGRTKGTSTIYQEPSSCMTRQQRTSSVQMRTCAPDIPTNQARSRLYLSCSSSML